ncbi:hypothetical protein L1887_05879 [Cichorium endivia]|nr:hypothetical protein L1887_05879 [Cichorium endivia]
MASCVVYTVISFRLTVHCKVDSVAAGVENQKSTSDMDHRSIEVTFKAIKEKDMDMSERVKCENSKDYSLLTIIKTSVNSHFME